MILFPVINKPVSKHGGGQTAPKLTQSEHTEPENTQETREVKTRNMMTILLLPLIRWYKAV